MVGYTKATASKVAATSVNSFGEPTTDLVGGTMVDMVATVTTDIEMIDFPGNQRYDK